MKQFFTIITLLALAAPCLAQDESKEPAATELLFYRGFYQEVGLGDPEGAITLYEEFLADAPGHKMAATAARRNYRLLVETGRDAAEFGKRYAKWLELPATGDEKAGATIVARGASGRIGSDDAVLSPDELLLRKLRVKLAKAIEEGDEEAAKQVEGEILQAVRVSVLRAGKRGGGVVKDPGDEPFVAVVLIDLPATERAAFRKVVIDRCIQWIDAHKADGTVDADKCQVLKDCVDAVTKAIDADQWADAQKAWDMAVKTVKTVKID